jgi:hypothetical protein
MKTNPNHPSSPTDNGLIYDHSGNCINEENIGLTKREHFAAMAMQGLCVGKLTNDIMTGQCVDIAQCAIEIADQLIAALNKEEQ